MKKFAAICAMMAAAVLAAFAYWDMLPPEKKRRYLDATDAYQRFHSEKY